jgi:FMN phosphatase YigB (HAD superfamily)
MAKSAVIFDVGRVFFRGDPGRAAQVHELYGLEAGEYRAFFSGPGAVETQLGGEPFTTEEMVAVIAGRLEPRLGDRAEEAARFICAPYIDPRAGEYDVEMLALAGDLHDSGAHVGILSNGPADCESGSMAPIFERGWVDASVISGRDGVGKPSVEAFDLILERMDVSAVDVCFIDDQPSNIAAAEALGISSFTYEDDSQQVRKWLRTEGLSI